MWRKAVFSYSSQFSLGYDPALHPVCHWVVSVPAVSSSLLGSVQSHTGWAAVHSAFLARTELSFLKFVLFGEDGRQSRAGEAALGVRSSMAVLAHGCNWASSDTADNIDAFLAPEHADSVCRELSGCLGWLNDALHHREIIYFTGASLTYISECKTVNLSRKATLCWFISKAAFFFQISPLIPGCFHSLRWLCSYSESHPRETPRGNQGRMVGTAHLCVGTALLSLLVLIPSRDLKKGNGTSELTNQDQNQWERNVSSKSSYNAASLVLHSLLCSAVTRSIVGSRGRKQLLNYRPWCGSCHGVWWSRGKECCNLNRVNAYDNIFTAL